MVYQNSNQPNNKCYTGIVIEINMEEYIREITLLQIIRAIKINAKILLLLMVLISIAVILISMAVNEDQENLYHTTAAIQINNYATNSFYNWTFYT